MAYTPLYKLEDGYYVTQFKKGDEVYAEVTDFNITKNKQYQILDFYGMDVEIVNDLGEQEWYTNEWFSMTKYT